MRLHAVFGILLIFALSGCMVGPDYVSSEPEMESHWTYSESPKLIEGIPEEPMVWWSTFNDPLLSELIEEALSENLDLKVAGLRVVQSRSSKFRAKMLLAPLAKIGGSASRSYLGENVDTGLGVKRGDMTFSPGTVSVTEFPEIQRDGHVDVFSVGTTAIWELDLWGKKRRGIKEAAARYEVAVAYYDDVAVVIAAETALTYIQIRTVEARITALEENLQSLEVLIAAKKSGGDDSTTLNQRYLAEALQGEFKSRLVDLRMARNQYENALCVLLGSAPGSLTNRLGEGMIPSPPPQIAVGIPTDLLRRRPDVRYAERMAAAQSERIGKMRAKLYPSFSLLGGIGLAASDTSNLFSGDSSHGMYGAKVDWNILLYPFIQERVRLEDARYEEAMYEFESAVIQATAEVENALVAYIESFEKEKYLSESSTAAFEAVESGMKAAEDSTMGFDGVFTALEYRLDLEDQKIEAVGTKATSMVRLYAALGGGWEVQEGISFVEEETRERMRDRTDWRTFGGAHRLDGTR
jgi:NodT family efflux transporter outer membrane factor (OMF) lipoprotein